MIKLTKSTIVAISLFTSSLYGMEQQNTRFTLHPTSKAEDIQTGLALTYAMLNATLTEQPSQNSQEDFDAFVQKNRQEREEQMSLIPSMVYALVHDAQKQPVGFIACHQDNQDEERVVIDKLCPGDPNNKTIAFMLIAYAAQKHPNAKKVWVALVKNNPLEKQLAENGFKPSDYVDQYHDAQRFQGWECDIATLVQKK